MSWRDNIVLKIYGWFASNRRGAMNKNTICLWYDKDAEEAARFYARTFPDSKVRAVHRAPGDYPSGKAGDALTVEFTVCGIPCIGLNGGARVKHYLSACLPGPTDKPN